MTGTIEKRVEALEADTSHADRSLRVVIAEPGETGDQSLRREGVERFASFVIVVTFS